jgi:hypothetical protein
MQFGLQRFIYILVNVTRKQFGLQGKVDKEKHNENNQIQGSFGYYGSKRLLEGHILVFGKNCAAAYFTQAGQGKVSKIANHNGKEHIFVSRPVPHSLDQHLPAHGPDEMAQHAQRDGKQNPPVIGIAHRVENFLLLFGRELAQKYPDEKNTDSQEYCKSDGILEFWIQGSMLSLFCEI